MPIVEKAEFQTWVRFILDYMTQEDLAAEAGVTQSAVSRWKTGGSVRDMDVAAKVEKIFLRLRRELTPSTDREHRAANIPVMGVVSGGGIVNPDYADVPREGLYQITAADVVLSANSVAYEIEDESMWPRYFQGDMVICTGHAWTYEQAVGWEAVCLLDDGRRFLRFVTQGTKPGLYNLEAHNAPPIRDVACRSISEVSAIIRKGKWTKVVRGEEKGRPS